MSKLQNVISCTRRSLLLSKIQEYTVRNFDNRASAVSRGARRGDRLLRLFLRVSGSEQIVWPFSKLSRELSHTTYNQLVFPRNSCPRKRASSSTRSMSWVSGCVVVIERCCRNTVCIGPRELIIRIDEIERYDSTYCTYITPFLNQAHVFGDESFLP